MVEAPPNLHASTSATVHDSAGSNPSLPSEPCNRIASKISNILISDGGDDVVHRPSAEFASSPACNSFLLGFDNLYNINQRRLLILLESREAHPSAIAGNPIKHRLTVGNPRRTTRAIVDKGCSSAKVVSLLKHIFWSWACRCCNSSGGQRGDDDRG